MPQIKPIRVHSCSPSDEKFPASNLILGKSKPWKCRDQGEKKAWVVLEFEEPTEINGIDIGNEHSCFIEVLVGNLGDSETDFKELLLTSSFQTPNESRNSENINRVRCFNKTALVESSASKKWTLLKLICTQPFNSRIHYGVSFVTVYTPTEETTATKKKEEIVADVSLKEETTKKRGLFSLREESPESDIEPSSLFARWKQSRQSGGGGEATSSPVTAAAAIRDARTSLVGTRSPLPATLTPSSSGTNKRGQSSSSTTTTPNLVRDRNRNTLLYDDSDDEAGDEKLERLIEKDKQRAEDQLKKEVKLHKKDSSTSTPERKKFKSSDSDEKISQKREENKEKEKKSEEIEQRPTRPKKPKTYKPFKKLLEGVVLTISGIQNPERGTLRSKALEMGAKYRGDWDDNCTHLICAFRNTPKYNQVQGIGKIVRKDWIFKCHDKRRHLPWRRFALDNKEAAKSESEEEIWDEKEKVEESAPKEEEKEKEIEEKLNKTEDDDVLMVYDQVEAPVVICDSGSDTEDEIERVRQEKGEEEKKDSSVEIVGDDNDDENNNNEEKDQSTTNGKDDFNADPSKFFSGKTFYLDEDNGAVKIIKCNGIITKYGGKVIESKECDFWIKSTAPPSNLLNKKPPIVRPLWLEETEDMDCWLPVNRYCF